MGWVNEYAENGIVNEADCNIIVNHQLNEYKRKLKGAMETHSSKNVSGNREIRFISVIELIDTIQP